MKNRVLGLAIAAMAMSPVFVGKAPMQARNVSPTPNTALPGSTTAPQGGGISVVDEVRKGYGSGGYRQHYRKQPGPGHLAAKRIKRGIRNRLRAKGQFRKAVR